MLKILESTMSSEKKDFLFDEKPLFCIRKNDNIYMRSLSD